MAHADEPPKAIDEIERIREELLSLQRSLEKMESIDGVIEDSE
jgi:hypothetical protein